MHKNYLTYDEYVEFGGEEAKAEFTLLEFKARKRIDYLTASRIQGMAEVPQAVKLCMMTLISMEKAAGAESQAINPAVTSFSTDGYSESYGKMLSADDAEKAMNRYVSSSLYGERDDNDVPLLYLGVR